MSSGAGGGRGRGRTASAAASRRGQERRGVVRRRDERARRAALVALRLEEGEEALAQLGDRPHRAGDCTSRTSARSRSPRMRISDYDRSRGGGRRLSPETAVAVAGGALLAPLRLLVPRSRRGSSRASGGSGATRASARSRPAARSATASAPRRSAGGGSSARARRARGSPGASTARSSETSYWCSSAPERLERVELAVLVLPASGRREIVL